MDCDSARNGANPSPGAYAPTVEKWLREIDLNYRPPAYEAGELPDCSIAQGDYTQTRANVMALHFVGFKDDRIWNARRVFGQPDFYHRNWDYRAWQESRVPGDVVVFATGTISDPPKTQSWDDSAADIMAYATEEQRR